MECLRRQAGDRRWQAPEEEAENTRDIDRISHKNEFENIGNPFRILHKEQKQRREENGHNSNKASGEL